MSSMECVDVSTFIGREITTVLNIAVDNVTRVTTRPSLV